MTLPTVHIHDTLTGRKSPVEPIRPGHLGLYVCGVTVYELCHIGHARVFVTFDVVVRFLRHVGYDVTFVRNHTDIDDKIIRRAAELGKDALTLAEEQIVELDRDMGSLGVQAPTHAPRVTESIDEIVAMVETLIERGHAYAVDGGDVFYRVDSFPGYGKLSGQRLDEMRAGERVAVDERKENPFDFALWKSARPGEPSWDSPWGPGRPGWHIECSAMSCTHLGPHFDVHGGGKDLTFPHHENEIAQSEGAHGHAYVNTWMHVGLVNVDGVKMSKSLGNFWTVRDVVAQVHPEAIRWFMLTAHYRKPVGYSQVNLDLAHAQVERLHRTRLALSALFEDLADAPAPDPQTLADFRDRFHAALLDDFNFPAGLAVLLEAIRTANDLLATKKLRRNAAALGRLAALRHFLLEEVRPVFGLLETESESVLAGIRDRLATRFGIDQAEVEQRIIERVAAREAKDWERADALRDALLARHVELMDTPEGTTWRIVPPEPESAAPGDVDG
ncbi:MAG: cysteine--tRNA ligase [Deltaproteobacteria bacterium]|nr:MAG: cysteine--tRNA ligase [Deltaproteobacteria bacterium]